MASYTEKVICLAREGGYYMAQLLQHALVYLIVDTFYTRDPDKFPVDMTKAKQRNMSEIAEKLNTAMVGNFREIHNTVGCLSCNLARRMNEGKKLPSIVTIQESGSDDNPTQLYKVRCPAIEQLGRMRAEKKITDKYFKDTVINDATCVENRTLG